MVHDEFIDYLNNQLNLIDLYAPVFGFLHLDKCLFTVKYCLIVSHLVAGGRSSQH